MVEGAWSCTHYHIIVWKGIYQTFANLSTPSIAEMNVATLALPPAFGYVLIVIFAAVLVYVLLPHLFLNASHAYVALLLSA